MFIPLTVKVFAVKPFVNSVVPLIVPPVKEFVIPDVIYVLNSSVVMFFVVPDGKS
jgi:hypothetical protein